jgi:hypothetical protein
VIRLDRGSRLVRTPVGRAEISRRTAARRLASPVGLLEPGAVRRRDFLAGAGAAVLAGCDGRAASRSAAPTTSTPAPTSEATPPPSAPPTPGTPEEVLARSTVPVLCFHQLREFRADDSAYARTMITPPAVFTAQALGDPVAVEVVVLAGQACHPVTRTGREKA